MSTLIEEIKKACSEYIEEHGEDPNVAYVKIRWRNEQDEFEETIAINGVEELDEDIFYYCNSVNDLTGLTEEGPGEDFHVTGFYGFDRI